MMMMKEGERRGLAELMANLEEWHPARRDYEAMKELLEERYPPPSPEALEALRAGIESARTEPLEVTGADRERIEFIRQTASGLMREATWNPEHRRAAMVECWDIARELWEAKPDGC